MPEALLLLAPATLLSTLLNTVPEGKKFTDRTRLLSVLAPKLSPGLFPKALELIRTEIHHPGFQAEALSNLAPYLPPDLFPEALDLIQHHIPGYSYPTAALCAIMTHLSLSQLKAALKIPFKHPELIAKTLEGSATRLYQFPDSPDKASLIQTILERTQQQISDEKSITRIITALSLSLHDEHLTAV